MNYKAAEVIKKNPFLTIVLLCFLITIDCKEKKNKYLQVQFVGNSKNWNISMKYNDSLNFISLKNNFFDILTYQDPGNEISINVFFDREMAIEEDISQVVFCKKNLNYRRDNFPLEYPCGMITKQDIIKINDEFFVFTESTCLEEGEIKYELYTLFDKGVLKIVFCIYATKTNKVVGHDKIKMIAEMINSLKIV